MIFDFTHICKTYDKNNYTREFFAATPCPKCPAVGRFNLHGSYCRYVIYFEQFKLKHTVLDIKRVICHSCKTTHAVMPGDIIPYKLLSLFVVIFILVLFHIRKTPALSVASQWGFSFQFVYSCLHAFALFKNNIHQYFMEISLGSAPLAPEPAKVLALIRKPYTDFQRNYLQLNRRPCFMRKFINKTNAPPIGIFAPAGAAT